MKAEETRRLLNEIVGVFPHFEVNGMAGEQMWNEMLADKTYAQCKARFKTYLESPSGTKPPTLHDFLGGESKSETFVDHTVHKYHVKRGMLFDEEEREYGNPKVEYYEEKNGHIYDNTGRLVQ